MTTTRPVITIDPALRFGCPHIKGISTDAIAGMVRAGESFATVADEYDLSVHEVILACWWEAQPAPRYRREWRQWADSVAPALGGWEPLDVEAIAEPPAKAACVITTPSGGQVHVAVGVDTTGPIGAELLRRAIEKAEDDPEALVMVGRCEPADLPRPRTRRRWWPFGRSRVGRAVRSDTHPNGQEV